MKLKQVKAYIGYLAAIGFSLFLLFFYVSCIWIGHEAKNLCAQAQADYGDKLDCVTALSQTLDDPNRGFRTRNHAIWALGQFGDARALPVLQKYYTGIIPEREPLAEAISQYELAKAITLANGGPNLSAWAWRQ